MTTAPTPGQPVDGAAFNPFDAATRACPYRAYRLLREAAPVCWHQPAGMWLVTGHRETATVLRDRRFSAAGGQRLREGAGALPATMLSTDPPKHTRLRAAIGREFTGAAVGRVRAGVGATAAGLVAAWPRQGTVDGVRDYAVPIVADALARLLGIPLADVGRFERSAAAVAPHLDPLEPPGLGSPAAAALDDLLDWFADLLAQRLGRPTDDVLGALVRAYECSALNADEVRSTCALLVIGGFEPLVDLIGTALWLLLSQDGGAAAPLGGGRDVAGIVEETLRYEPPIHFAARVPLDDVALGGIRVSAGEPVVLLLGAANRDPHRFEAPDRWQPSRRPNRHLTFGAGIHACPGAAFTRLVAGVAVRAVTDGARMIRLADAPAWRASFVPRGLDAVHIAVGG